MNCARLITAALMCALASQSLLFCVPRTRVANIPLNNPHSLDEPEKIRLFGLARLDAVWGSRQSLGFTVDALTLLPAAENQDYYGCDINSCSECTITPANSLFGADIGTFKVGRALITGRVLGAFSGTGLATAGLFAIGQAYTQIDWPNTRIVVGNDYHPFMSKITHPNVVSINSGSPFAPIADTPQIRLTQKIGTFSISPAILTQFIYTSDGPRTFEPIYLYNSGLPTFNCMIEYENENAALGIGIDIKKLRPRLSVESLPSEYTYVNTATVTSFIMSSYINLQFERLVVLGQMCGGQNGTELLLPGGYGVSNKDTKTSRECYANTYFLSLWGEIDINTNNNLKPGFFFGYAKTFGTRHQILFLPPDHEPCDEPIVYGIDRLTAFSSLTNIIDITKIKGIDSCARASAYMRYLFSPLELGLEVEITRAVFGFFNTHAHIVKANSQTALRLLGVASCYF